MRRATHAWIFTRTVYHTVAVADPRPRLKMHGMSASIAFDRVLLAVSAASGFLAVALGAFGAHGLRNFLASVEDGVTRQGWWETGAHYHLVHAVAIGLAAAAASGGGRGATIAGWAFFVGTLLFSGSLYTMTLTGIRVLGAITPLGGVAFLVGWGALFVHALRG